MFIQMKNFYKITQLRGLDSILQVKYQPQIYIYIFENFFEMLLF